MCRALCVLVIALFVGLVRAWDIAVTAGDRIEFYTDDGNKTDTVRFNSQNLTALAYNEVHNMLLYVDKQSGNDTICGYNMTSVENKCYIEKNGRNIQGLAFDPVTEILFFTDTKERSINWFSFKPESENNVYGNLLIKMDAGIPTDIIVDSCRGYIYWINTNYTTSTIERARFDGSDREIIINAIHKLDLHSLVIDQQAQKIYWFMPVNSVKLDVYSADLNGENMKSIIWFSSLPGYVNAIDHPNSLIVSRNSLFILGWCITCGPKRVWKFPKPIGTFNYNTIFQVQTENVVGIAANYKLKEQFQGIAACNHVLNKHETNFSFKIVREDYVGPYCVHGIKSSLNGKSVCKCTPGFTGVRCEVSVCENYCLQGNCSFTEEGLPECRCNAGYSGERCEVNVCQSYCLNNGTCSLNEEDEPVCECVEEYEGGRCEVPAGLNKGDDSLNEEVKPACQYDDSHEGSGLETDKNKVTSTTSSYFLIEKNITLADLLENWSKRAH